MHFIISEKDGYKYSIKSGDKNPIHINKLYGYNSIYGEKVCHGTLVLKRLLSLIYKKKRNNSLNDFYFEINFIKFASYNKKIKINLHKKKLYQNQNEIAEIYTSKNSFFENEKMKKKYTINTKKKKSNNFATVFYLLDELTKYVGTVYPGENSIIQNIRIFISNKYKFDSNKIQIYSKKVSKKLPLIKNKLIFENVMIYFFTYERPYLKIEKKKIKINLLNEIRKITEPVLIIGSSSGIGLEIFDLIKNNKKIKIFATYNMNKFKTKNSNIKIFKLDLNKKFQFIEKYFRQYNQLRIYYFATPKIYLNNYTKNKINDYKNFYINYPKKILEIFKTKRVKFFYPSTIYADNNNSIYAKIKKKGEKILNNCRSEKTIINILRIDEINTKQNLSLIKRKLPSFQEMLEKNENYRKQIFFY